MMNCLCLPNVEISHILFRKKKKIPYDLLPLSECQINVDQIAINAITDLFILEYSSLDR